MDSTKFGVILLSLVLVVGLGMYAFQGYSNISGLAGKSISCRINADCSSLGRVATCVNAKCVAPRSATPRPVPASPPPVCTSSAEICDGADNDCDSQIDEGCPICTNYDNNLVGRAVYSFGGYTITRVDGRETIQYDGCVNSEYVRERICVPQNRASPETYQDVSCRDFGLSPDSTCIDVDGSGPNPGYCENTITPQVAPCTDSDSTDSANINDPSYVIGGNVASGGITYVDRCDEGGLDLFENFCDNGVRREIDASCSGFGADYRCITDSQGQAYCGR